MAELTDADVELVENAWWDAPPCGHNVPTDYPESCGACCARAVLSALSAAGKLADDDAECLRAEYQQAVADWNAARAEVGRLSRHLARAEADAVNCPDAELVERLSGAVHVAWMETKRAQGVTSRRSESGEELMMPYAQLSEAAKDLDRGTVRGVLAAINRGGLVVAAAGRLTLGGGETGTEYNLRFRNGSGEPRAAVDRAAKRAAIRRDRLASAERASLVANRSIKCAGSDWWSPRHADVDGGCRNDGTTCLCECHDAKDGPDD